jgi:hypothetical protein
MVLTLCLIKAIILLIMHGPIVNIRSRINNGSVNADNKVVFHENFVNYLLNHLSLASHSHFHFSSLSLSLAVESLIAPE